MKAPNSKSLNYETDIDYQSERYVKRENDGGTYFRYKQIISLLEGKEEENTNLVITCEIRGSYPYHAV